MLPLQSGGATIAELGIIRNQKPGSGPAYNFVSFHDGEQLDSNNCGVAHRVNSFLTS